MNNQTEMESLQNAATRLGLIVHEKFTEDRRRTVKRYFLTKEGNSISGVMDYEQANYFLLGYLKAKQ